MSLWDIFYCSSRLRRVCSFKKERIRKRIRSINKVIFQCSHLSRWNEQTTLISQWGEFQALFQFWRSWTASSALHLIKGYVYGHLIRNSRVRANRTYVNPRYVSCTFLWKWTGARSLQLKLTWAPASILHVCITGLQRLEGRMLHKADTFHDDRLRAGAAQRSIASSLFPLTPTRVNLFGLTLGKA